MSIPLKQLKNSNGDAFYPATSAAGTYLANGTSVEEALNNIPTKTGQLTNDANFVHATKPGTAEATHPDISGQRIQNNAITNEKINWGTIIGNPKTVKQEVAFGYGVKIIMYRIFNLVIIPGAPFHPTNNIPEGHTVLDEKVPLGFRPADGLELIARAQWAPAVSLTFHISPNGSQSYTSQGFGNNYGSLNAVYVTNDPFPE